MTCNKQRCKFIRCIFTYLPHKHTHSTAQVFNDCSLLFIYLLTIHHIWCVQMYSNVNVHVYDVLGCFSLCYSSLFCLLLNLVSLTTLLQGDRERDMLCFKSFIYMTSSFLSIKTFQTDSIYTICINKTTTKPTTTCPNSDTYTCLTYLSVVGNQQCHDI